MRLSHFCKRILQTQLLSLLRIAFFVNKAFAATLLQLRSVFHSCNFPWRKPKDVVPPPVGFLLMKIASRSRWNVSLFVPDRALFLSELEELKSTRRLRLISKNVAYDLFVPSDTRRDHCTSAPTAVCVVSPNFIGQASGNSTKTRPLRRTPTLGWKITHSGSLISWFVITWTFSFRWKRNENTGTRHSQASKQPQQLTRKPILNQHAVKTLIKI